MFLIVIDTIEIKPDCTIINVIKRGNVRIEGKYGFRERSSAGACLGL